MPVPVSRAVVPLRRRKARVQRRRLPVSVHQPRPGSELSFGQGLERGGVRLRLSPNSKLPS